MMSQPPNNRRPVGEETVVEVAVDFVKAWCGSGNRLTCSTPFRYRPVPAYTGILTPVTPGEDDGHGE